MISIERTVTLHLLHACGVINRVHQYYPFHMDQITRVRPGLVVPCERGICGLHVLYAAIINVTVVGRTISIITKTTVDIIIHTTDTTDI